MHKATKVAEYLITTYFKDQVSAVSTLSKSLLVLIFCVNQPGRNNNNKPQELYRLAAATPSVPC